MEDKYIEFYLINGSVLCFLYKRIKNINKSEIGIQIEYLTEENKIITYNIPFTSMLYYTFSEEIGGN